MPHKSNLKCSEKRKVRKSLALLCKKKTEKKRSVTKGRNDLQEQLGQFNVIVDQAPSTSLKDVENFLKI